MRSLTELWEKYIRPYKERELEELINKEDILNKTPCGYKDKLFYEMIYNDDRLCMNDKYCYYKTYNNGFSYCNYK